jgi:hypothetical protein
MASTLPTGTECEYGCSGDDEAIHNGWYRCTPESRAILAEERAKLARLSDPKQHPFDTNGFPVETCRQCGWGQEHQG